MTRTHLAACLTALLGACTGIFIESSSECVAACQRALDCGLLPSSLGAGTTLLTAQADCERLCGQSPVDDADTLAVLDCLHAENSELAWCTDETSDNYASIDGCAATVACFDRSTFGSSVLGSVSLEVSLISFSAFLAGYDDDADALTALYSDEEPSQTCAYALCDAANCKLSHGDPEIADSLACDAALCGTGSIQAGASCEEVEVSGIDILAIQSGNFANSQPIEGATSTCDTASVTFDAVNYGLRPGPVAVSARISGSLAAGDLRSIGYEVSAEIDDSESVDYCFTFPGMNVLLRSGNNRAVIPVAGIAELVSYGLTPSPCHG